MAIQKQYTAVCTLADLFTLEPGNSRLNQHGIEELCENYRQQGKRIVFTNGCFDVLHSGHVRYLKEAKKRGDVLIVGINNDASVKRLKGSSRPVNRLKNRMEVLSELSCVDHVIPFGKLRADNPIELIKRVQPHVFVKGADYKEAFLPEANVLRELGIEIVFLPLVKNQSTSKIISRIRALPTSGKVFLGA